MAELVKWPFSEDLIFSSLVRFFSLLLLKNCCELSYSVGIDRVFPVINRLSAELPHNFFFFMLRSIICGTLLPFPQMLGFTFTFHQALYHDISNVCCCRQSCLYLLVILMLIIAVSTNIALATWCHVVLAPILPAVASVKYIFACFYFTGINVICIYLVKKVGVLVAHLYIWSKHWERKLCILLTLFACLTSYMKLEGLFFSSFFLGGGETVPLYVFGELNTANFNIQFLLSDSITQFSSWIE